MTAKRLIVESAVKDELRNGEDITVSSAALEWVNAQTVAAVESCRMTGRRTPGGRLMAPDGCNAFPHVTTEIAAEPRADGRARPERLCPRAKEFAALSPEQQAEHLHKLYASAPAINEAAIDLLKDLYREQHLFDEFFARARDIIVAAQELRI